MTTIKTFRELLVWQKAHELVLQVYKNSEIFPKHELFGLTSQVRRSAASVPANIVEGFRRKSVKEGVHFYHIADASLEETKYHLLLAKDLSYFLEEKNYNTLDILTEEVGKLLTRWIQSQYKYLT